MIRGALTSRNNSCRRSLFANAGYLIWTLRSHASIWETGVLGGLSTGSAPDLEVREARKQRGQRRGRRGAGQPGPQRHDLHTAASRNGPERSSIIARA